MPSVRIPTVLRKHTDGQSTLTADGTTVREVFAKLVADHPDLQDKLLDGGDVRGFINVYVEDEDIRYLDGLDSTVQAGDEISIMPAVAGGAERSEHAPRHLLAGGAERSEHARRHLLAGGGA